MFFGRHYQVNAAYRDAFNAEVAEARELARVNKITAAERDRRLLAITDKYMGQPYYCVIDAFTYVGQAEGPTTAEGFNTPFRRRGPNA